MIRYRQSFYSFMAATPPLANAAERPAMPSVRHRRQSTADALGQERPRQAPLTDRSAAAISVKLTMSRWAWLPPIRIACPRTGKIASTARAYSPRAKASAPSIRRRPTSAVTCRLSPEPSALIVVERPDEACRVVGVGRAGGGEGAMQIVEGEHMVVDMRHPCCRRPAPSGRRRRRPRVRAATEAKRRRYGRASRRRRAWAPSSGRSRREPRRTAPARSEIAPDASRCGGP